MDIEEEFGEMVNALETIGWASGANARAIFDAFKAQQRKLYQMLDAMVALWPFKGSVDDIHQLAGILGVELWTHREKNPPGQSDSHTMRWRPAPEGFDPESQVLVGSTEGWERE